MAQIGGTIRANNNTYSGYHFVGMTYRFYYKSGTSYVPIGTYTIRDVSGSLQTSFVTINSTYFDGSRLYNPMILENTYDPSLPNEGGLLQTSFNMPPGVFPNHAGMQFAFTMEAIDQINVTSLETAYKDLINPILHPGSMTAPSINASQTSLCNGNASFISTSPDYSGTYNYRWYRDNVELGETGSAVTTTIPGTYKAAIYDGCMSATTDEIVISAGSSPTTPTIVTNTASQLCDGASAVIFVQGSPSGTITWSNGMTGNSITVSAAGSYTARASNGCGTSAWSNAVGFTTLNSPSAPNAVNSGASNLCNGSSTTLYAGGSAPFTWYKDDVPYNSGNALSVNTAGTYTVKSNNSCGYSAASNPIVITTGARPVAPIIATNISTPLCPGATAQVYVTNPTAPVTWNTGQSGTSIEVSTAGSFYATQSNSCGTSLQSNVITFTTKSIAPAPTVTSSSGTSLCNGSTTTLSTTPSAGGTIYWTNGAMGNSITVSSAGTYAAREATDCGFGPYSNSITITAGSPPAAPTVTPPGNFLLCNGESATFTSSGTNITWSNGVTGNSMTTAIAGTYYATDRNGCSNSANSNAVVVTTGNCPTPSPGTSFFVCPGGLKTLDAGAGYETYSWNNGETTQKISVGPGNYAVTVTKNGCSATSVMVTVGYYTVVTPVINPSGPLTFCNGGSVTLSASTGSAYAWSNGATTNPITVTTPGTYFVTVTDANGCQATSANTTVVVNPLPTASIAGTNAVCQNSASPSILFTGNNAIAPYTFFYKINGGSTQTVTTTSGNSVSVVVPTSAFGIFAYELVGVQESSSTTCYNAASGTATVTVNELPAATIAGTTTVCKNSSAPSITFTGSGGVAPYTFTYSINGGTSQTVTTTSGNSVSVSVPTSAPGTFAYTLISVKESSGTTCSNTASGTATVSVRDLPNASIAGSTAVCQFAATPKVTFTGSNGVAPYTFTYRINDGTNQTITTTSGISVSLPVPTNVAGSFVYTLLSVAESGTATCANTASGSVEVVVNAQPVNAIIATPNTHLCNGETGNITVMNWQEGFSYTWYRDGVLFATSTAQSISVTLAGSYTVMVTSPEGCTAAALSNVVLITAGTISNPVITGKLKVCEGGKTNLYLTPTNALMAYEKILWTHLQKEPPLYDSVNNSNRFSAAAGQYRILVKREGCVDSTSVAVTANDTEVPAGELTIFPKAIPYGGRTTLTAQVNNTERYEWDFGDGRKAVTVSGSLEQAFFSTHDTVLVRLRAVSETNCQADFTAMLLIGKPGKPSIPDVPFAGNLKDWNFFPVPFREELKLSVILQRNEKIRLDLFTGDGSWVRSYEFSGKKGENLFQLHKLESLAPGVVYFVTGIYNGEKHYDKIYKY
ncbi:hypothetical protein GWC95_15415 [Sediminibacterium roseum]|uniref:PKD domain-containing protein n=1 Tax=Sediminibacterium roseum TaxID=1978412 RepID=A0ABW9ZVZ9_9BACT|nr:hypothetical protein [Sediminibacterium roseum]NCI51316.1 hypothetical protein [Sediminibacterium roseum]